LDTRLDARDDSTCTRSGDAYLDADARDDSTCTRSGDAYLDADVHGDDSSFGHTYTADHRAALSQGDQDNTDSRPCRSHATGDACSAHIYGNANCRTAPVHRDACSRFSYAHRDRDAVRHINGDR
jgi:hypothetical protein